NNLVTRLDGQESSLFLYSRHKSRLRANVTAGQPEAFDPKRKPNSFMDSLDVNKPYLPLAPGEYSVKISIAIVASCSSFWLRWIVGSWPLFWALFVSFMLGTAYSINFPLLRWKRYALVAAMCILADRTIIVQIAFYLHIQTHVFGRLVMFTRPLVFATAFMSFFSVGIALFKVRRDGKMVSSVYSQIKAF
ncbi:unnamed protein product, partial [Eruca vesicaria subsp. sativa]|nr:unnamed protein product [Eruca vesicaria subsp. sativa]